MRMWHGSEIINPLFMPELPAALDSNTLMCEHWEPIKELEEYPCL